MMSKKKLHTDGIVFSTDPAFKLGEDGQQEQDTLDPHEQKLRVRLDSKQRAGKAVSLIEGFIGKNEDLEQLGKKLKTYCGTGGAVKDWKIIIQGDQRPKLVQWLIQNGYKHTKQV